MTQPRIKVLVIGAAFSADLHMEGYQRCSDLARVVGICDMQPDRIDALASRYRLEDYTKYSSYEQAIAESGCDVVDICLPNFLHHPVALCAFRHGKHVVCEKPLAITAAQAQEMAEAAKAAEKCLYYAEDWLFAPAVVRALEIVREGAIGDLLFIRAREAHSGSHSPFAQTIAGCGGGCMIHLGIHPVGLALALGDNRWTCVTADVTGGMERNLVHKAMEGEDWASCSMSFENGIRAVVEANYVTVGGMEDVIDFYGTKGCLHVDLDFSSAVRCFSIPGVSYTSEKAEITTGWSSPAVDEKYNLGYVGEIRHFMERASTGRDAMPGLRGIDGLECMRAVEAIYAAAKAGTAVKNPNL